MSTARIGPTLRTTHRNQRHRHAFQMERHPARRNNMVRPSPYSYPLPSTHDGVDVLVLCRFADRARDYVGC